MIGAALFFGLTLYCYALSWIMVPLFLVMVLILYWKKIPFDRYTGISAVLLFLLALPLLLFLAINLDLLPEIRTAFLSIPKLESFRGDEMSFANILNSLKDTLRVILTQFDGVTYTSSRLVGAYYYITTPFFVFGIIWHVMEFFKNFKFGQCNMDFVWLLWLVSAGVICILNANVTTIHINLIHIPIIFYSSYGILKFADLIRSVHVVPALTVFLSVSFVLFFHDYSASEHPYFFGAEADEVIESAKEMVSEDETIYIYGVSTIKYSNLLWHELPDIQDYYENAVYDPTSHPAWQELLYYNGFGYITDISQATDDGVYIIDSQYEIVFHKSGYSIAKVNDLYSIAYK